MKAVGPVWAATDRMRRWLLPALLAVALAAGARAGEDVAPSGWRSIGADDAGAWSLALFGGEGTDRNFSETLSNPFAGDTTGDLLVALAGARELFRYRDMLSIEVEAMYGYHFGREDYHEVGTALYARWRDFPWNETLVTTFALGLGPSYTTIYPELETQADPGDRSRWLNQFNIEATFALPRDPSTALLFRLQHRSGVFGTFGGVWDASNFLTIGLRRQF